MVKFRLKLYCLGMSPLTAYARKSMFRSVLSQFGVIMGRNNVDLSSTSGRTVLQEDLRRQIEDGTLRPGQRIASLRQLARDYGLAFETVRAGVKELTQRGVLESRPGSGTYVSEHPPAGRSTASSATSDKRWVALLMNPREHVYGEIAQQLTRCMEDHGFRSVQLSPGSDHQDRQALEQLVKGWGDDPPHAIVLHSFWPDLVKAIDDYCGRRSHVVSLVRPVSSPASWHRVGPDIEVLSQQAVHYLVERGHTHVGVVVHGRRLTADYPENERKRQVSHTPLIQGVGDGLRRLTPAGRLAIHYQQGAWDDEYPEEQFSAERIDRLTAWLDRPDRPTALIGADFRMAVARRAAERLGLVVPDDLALLGIGDTPWSRVLGFPSISLREPVLARRIMSLIAVDPAEYEGATVRVTVPTELRVEGAREADARGKSRVRPESQGRRRGTAPIYVQR